MSTAATVFIGIVLLIVAAVIALLVYRYRHPAGYAEHKEDAEAAAKAVRKAFDKDK